MTIHLDQQETNAEKLSLSAADSVWNGSGRHALIPFTIPTAQAYYWGFAWQSGERETLASLDAGEYIDFDSEDPEDAARWLREPDDDDE